MNSSGLFCDRPDIKAYFDSLPVFIQESLMMQGAPQINSVDELRSIAENIMKN